MKYIRLLLPLLLLTTVQTNASRTKANLIPAKEKEIIHLLKNKIKVLDKLIKEAKIYKNEKDPLIKKDFFQIENAFVTKGNQYNEYIQTNIENPAKKPKRTTGHIPLGSNKIGIPRTDMYNPINTRDILGIKMKIKDESKISFSSHINYLHQLENRFKTAIRKIHKKTQKKELAKILNTTYEKNFKALNIEVLEKYYKLRVLLSHNNITTTLNDSIDSYKAKSWSISSRMFIFEFDLKEDEFYKKNYYKLSIELDNTFRDLLKKEAINPTTRPAYYENKVFYILRCLETNKPIKYKSRICINNIDTDKDEYFTDGVFETRENNFLQVNKKSFNYLSKIDKALRESSQDYIKYLILKMNTPTKKTEINLEDGL